jgi:tRNA pseudouridine38-40 synthase
MGMKQRYFIELAYNGRNYNGWQVQKNAPSVQETLNQGLVTVLNQPINVTGCGRTDTGVHARQFIAHFDFEYAVDTKLLMEKLNGFLPKDMVIHKIISVSPTAHARFDAISRTYRYYISVKKDPFLGELSYYHYGELDLDQMNRGASLLLVANDFTSFSKVGTQVKTNHCKVTEAFWQREKDMNVFTITADRFLRNMVRAIVGTLLNVGRHKITLDEFEKIIKTRNRANAGESVPAQGLFLESVQYPTTIYIHPNSANPPI